MNDEKKYTELDLVMASRAAYVLGVEQAKQHNFTTMVRSRAASIFPMPPESKP